MLAKNWRESGNLKSAHKLVTSHLRLVAKIAMGYKGYGLSAMIEIFSGILTGLGHGVEPSGRHNDGCFMAVFKVEAFRSLETFKKEVADFAHYLKNTLPADGFDAVLNPGEIEFKREQERSLNGIEVEDATWSKLHDLAQQYGMEKKLGF